jgi:hypothetical protein
VSCSQQVRDSAQDPAKINAEILADLPSTACFPPMFLADVQATAAISVSANRGWEPDANCDDRRRSEL